MFDIKYITLFYWIILHTFVITLRITLRNTDETSKNQNNTGQHNCLRILASSESYNVDAPREITSYCIGDLASNFHIEQNNFSSKFTFRELEKANITSQQLYHWSAPIDLAERYEFYLNQLSTPSNNLTMATDVFYNCTLPRFGPMCQYEFPTDLSQYYPEYPLSLQQIIDDFFLTHKPRSIDLTCYKHIQCDRGFPSVCLDWTEICDGKKDCIDGGQDEEHCWQLEFNVEQAHSKPFYLFNTFDQASILIHEGADCSRTYPLIECEEVLCPDILWTSSCSKSRQERLFEALFSIKDNSTSDDCWSAFKCVLPISDSLGSICHHFCDGNNCVEIIEDQCPPIFYMPVVPILFGHIRLAFEKNDSKRFINKQFQHPYVCYDNSQYDAYFVSTSKILFNNVTCFRSFDALTSSIGRDDFNEYYFTNLHRALRKYNLPFNYTAEFCKRENTYQCINSSKCIPIKYRNDGNENCPFGDDEDTRGPDSIYVFHEHFYTNDICINVSSQVSEYDYCNITFQILCDGYIAFHSVIINGQSETDETECKQWECDNVYTRCNGFWNCFNGADELGCNPLAAILNCSSNEHICVSPYTNQLMCLSIEKADDRQIDCLGATDEPSLCRKSDYQNGQTFYCIKQNIGACLSFEKVCDKAKDCDNNDDERFCEEKKPFVLGESTDSQSIEQYQVQQVLSALLGYFYMQPVTHFSLGASISSDSLIRHNIGNIAYSSSSKIQQPILLPEAHCHYGLGIRVWQDEVNNISTIICFCPDSLYGNYCQYQNQRVSLTLNFQALSDSWQKPFAIIILLIDNSDEQIIHSYEQFTYLSVRDCQKKFNNYLLYSTQPKDPKKKYAIHIDIYDKHFHTYRGSLLYSIPYSFLPVHRLSFKVNIPKIGSNFYRCSMRQCIHGKCTRYSHSEQETEFCQCEQGWSGRYCTIPYKHLCSPKSLSVGIDANNRSICICPTNKFGPRCLLTDYFCTNSTCNNRGQCIPSDEHSTLERIFTCICPPGFSGDQCEIVDNEIMLSFDTKIILSRSLFIHFIEVIKDGPHVRATTLKTIPFTENFVVVQWSRKFHLIFIEFSRNNYYLAIIQNAYNRSEKVSKIIQPSDRCYHISTLVNKTVFEFHPLRRMKHYHSLCSNPSFQLSCFYDDYRLCFCYNNIRQRRLTNCFGFDHQMKFDCSGYNECENDGECFQDTLQCPQRSMCVCPQCFYGRYCQFTTIGFSVSLDNILGYHIQPHISIVNQSTIIQISITLMLIFVIAGIINGILSLITFKNKSVREIGCGLYLLGSSITTLLIVILLSLKFWILLLAQMSQITNRLFLQIQCISFDFLVRICLNMDQWLNACVAIERAFTIIQGTRFVKKKSKRMAKFVIAIVLVFNIGSSIHDPIYRRLIDEENIENDEKRIWCVVTYSSNLQIYNSIMHIVHFFAPFIINLISAIILITKKSRQKSNLQSKRSRTEILREQYQQHKHLFIAPVILVILAIPRLIISFASKCMNSVNEAWLFLIGYFISFIPPTLTFVIFVLPSKFYKKEFNKSIIQYRTTIRRYLQFQ
ncbi:hypothetical protein I4U23_011660 [Adineta vaga]|nr:hypothetical protein I4U23_011660 [Adineta vaga]